MMNDDITCVHQMKIGCESLQKLHKEIKLVKHGRYLVMAGLNTWS